MPNDWLVGNALLHCGYETSLPNPVCVTGTGFAANTGLLNAITESMLTTKLLNILLTIGCYSIAFTGIALVLTHTKVSFPIDNY